MLGRQPELQNLPPGRGVEVVGGDLAGIITGRTWFKPYKVD